MKYLRQNRVMSRVYDFVKNYVLFAAVLAVTVFGMGLLRQTRRTGTWDNPVVGPALVRDQPRYEESGDRSQDLGQLVFGINLTRHTKRLYAQTRPFQYLDDYKNPCWLEKLPADFLEQYRRSEFSAYGQQTVRRLEAVFRDRLRSGTAPWRVRCLPYFYIAGIMKSGTTDFYDNIIRHPDVYGPWVKEPHYWNRRRYPQGIQADRKIRHIEFDEYVNEFDLPAHEINQSVTTDNGRLTHQKIIVDASARLFWEDNGWHQHPAHMSSAEPWYTTARALHAVQPGARIIVLLREPVTRLYSEFINQDRHGTPAEFDLLVNRSLQSYTDCLRTRSPRACVYNTTLANGFTVSPRSSMYAVYLRDWLEVFPKHQLMVIPAERYYRDRAGTFAEVFRFLGLESVPGVFDDQMTTDNNPPHLQRHYAPMWNSTRRRLQQFFEPFNADLRTLLNQAFWTS